MESQEIEAAAEESRLPPSGPERYKGVKELPESTCDS